MSAKAAGSIGSIIVGVVLIIAGFYSGGATWGAAAQVLSGALAVAGGVYGLTFSPKSLTAEAAKAQDLQFTSAAEGFPVPVIFGEQKVVPNFMNWHADTFHSVGQQAGGKGGGGNVPTGVIDYYLTFELALCMGPIDEIGQVISVPGDVLCRGSAYSIGNGATISQSGTSITCSLAVFTSEMVAGTLVWADGETVLITAFVNASTLRVATSQTKAAQIFQIFSKIPQIVFSDLSDYQEFVLGGVNEGGNVRVYRGNSDQTRIEAGDPYFDTGMNYRNLAWALHQDFWIGRGTPTPKTYQYIVRRTSRCVRDNNTVVTGIETRGSADPNNPAYYQSNPAAAIYEIWTNRLWGNKKSSDLFDEDSFIACSQFFKAKNIGISFTLDSAEKISAVMDGLRLQLKTLLLWNGDKYKLVCLMDVSQTSETIVTLTSNDVDDLKVIRPLWPSTTNDVRAEYNSRTKLYKSDAIHVQNMANIELTGRINSKGTTLRAFTDFNIALKQATRILMEASYPAAMASFYINRFNSHIQVGDCVRIIWYEWGANAVSAYFSVNKLEPQGKLDDRIKVTATEDVFLCPVEGVETSVTLPVAQAWEKIVEISESDLSKFVTPTSQNGSIFPILAIELPGLFDPSGDSWLSIFGAKPSGGTIGAQVSYAVESSNSYTQIAGNLDFAITGTMTTGILHTRATDRSPSFVEFTAAVSEAATLLAVNKITNESDDLEIVDRATTDYLIIGEEIIKVGRIEVVSAGIYRATHVVRGCFGTPVDVHAIGEAIFYRQTISHGFNLTTLGVPTGIIKFKAYPLTGAGVNEVGDVFYAYKNGEHNQEVMALGTRLLGVEVYDCFVDIVSFDPYLFLYVRFRYNNSGASSRAFFGQYNSSLNKVNGVILDVHSSQANSVLQGSIYSDTSVADLIFPRPAIQNPPVEFQEETGTWRFKYTLPVTSDETDYGIVGFTYAQESGRLTARKTWLQKRELL